MGGGQGKKLRSKKRSSKTIDIVSECKWCHMCVCSPFQVKKMYLKFVNWLNS